MFDLWEMLIYVLLSFLGIWLYLSWRNSRFNDEEKDVTDASCLSEYVIRKIFRLFIRK